MALIKHTQMTRQREKRLVTADRRLEIRIEEAHELRQPVRPVALAVDRNEQYPGWRNAIGHQLRLDLGQGGQ